MTSKGGDEIATGEVTTPNNLGNPRQVESDNNNVIIDLLQSKSQGLSQSVEFRLYVYGGAKADH
jgi:hypothetical protein